MTLYIVDNKEQISVLPFWLNRSYFCLNRYLFCLIWTEHLQLFAELTSARGTAERFPSPFIDHRNSKKCKNSGFTAVCIKKNK
jgi:hypothetical protein